MNQIKLLKTENEIKEAKILSLSKELLIKKYNKENSVSSYSVQKELTTGVKRKYDVTPFSYSDKKEYNEDVITSISKKIKK